MPLNFMFRQPKNELEKGGRTPTVQQAEDMELAKQCPECGKHIPLSELWDNYNACTCGHHFRMNARQRINFLCDAGTYLPMDEQMKSHDLLSFPGYERKLHSAELSSKENEAVLCGIAEIGGVRCCLFIMESYFMMGSMGTVVGEKITRLFEYAAAHSLPVVGFTVSGGARMQEGILSLMQMAKTSSAVKRHSDAGNFYLAVRTDPTTGGVTASFAMEGDVILA
ncbi:MAG: acetyl-CoA carboxylase carboxyltransferase subunit beta, partial [Oscillospiraceae bacterium]|nr:acetyl-CoA carboxylase carboxyltransferase subunit beta [Oscillospiraceae bacterium]